MTNTMETIDPSDLLPTAMRSIRREFPGEMFGGKALLEASIELAKALAELEKARAMAYAAWRGV